MAALVLPVSFFSNSEMLFFCGWGKKQSLFINKQYSPSYFIIKSSTRTVLNNLDKHKHTPQPKHTREQIGLIKGKQNSIYICSTA